MRFFSLILLCSMLCIHSYAQTDTLPGYETAKFDLSKLPTMPGKFNRRDAVMMVLRQGNCFAKFADPRDAGYENKFVFADVDGDKMLDAVFSDSLAYYSGYRTFIFLMRNQQYVKCLESPGYITRLDTGSGKVNVRLYQRASGEVYMNIHRFYSITKSSAKEKLNWWMMSMGEIPAEILPEPRNLVIATVATQRAAPEVKDEPVMDHNMDGKPDGKGNIIATWREGTPAYLFGFKEIGGQPWAYVMVPVRDPAPGNILLHTHDAPAYVMGWIEAELLKEKQ